MSAESDFRTAMSSHGLIYDGPIIADGKRRRFTVPGDHAPNSWYVLFANGHPAGAFGCWKRSIKGKWCQRGGYVAPASWKTKHQQRQEQQARLAAADLRHAKARAEAEKIVKGSRPAIPSFPYLTKKRVKVHGELRHWFKCLVLPLCDVNGKLHSLQFIDWEGNKRFLANGRVQGCFFTLSRKAEGPLVLAEGYATGATIVEATGYAAVAAMNCGNLLPVALALRAKWPDRDIIIAADDDQQTPGNPGVTKATEAAKAIGARLAIPNFKYRLANG